MESQRAKTVKLGLGTVQFGLDYGISNTEGRVAVTEVSDILATARSAGITLLDTAAAYGKSEKILGQCAGDEPGFRVVTKTPAFKDDIIAAESGRKLVWTFENSLEQLKRKSLYGVLLHSADDLLKPGGEYLIDALRGLRAKRLVRKIGVSVYTDRQIDQVLDVFTPDIVQLPLNLLDQRLIKSGHLAELKKCGVEIHTRSAFLQGLLLMDPEKVDPFFEPIREHLRQFRKALNESGVTPLQAALKFCLERDEVDTVLVGVCSCRELKEICGAVSREVPDDFDFDRWSIEDTDILNPSQWNLQDVIV